MDRNGNYSRNNGVDRGIDPKYIYIKANGE